MTPESLAPTQTSSAKAQRLFKEAGDMKARLHGGCTAHRSARRFACGGLRGRPADPHQPPFGGRCRELHEETSIESLSQSLAGARGTVPTLQAGDPHAAIQAAWPSGIEALGGVRFVVLA